MPHVHHSPRPDLGHTLISQSVHALQAACPAAPRHVSEKWALAETFYLRFLRKEG